MQTYEEYFKVADPNDVQLILSFAMPGKVSQFDALITEFNNERNKMSEDLDNALERIIYFIAEFKRVIET